MAVLTKEQFLEKVSNLITGTNDEDIQNIEDFTDTYNDLETRINNSGDDWKRKYDENDKAWRERYKQRFFTPEPDSKSRNESFLYDKSNEDTEQVETAENTLTYETLFDEKKGE